MNLPDLVHDFRPCRVDGISFGPRREVTLECSLLELGGSNGRWVGGVSVRFGGVENLDEVRAALTPHLGGAVELADLCYSPARKSKPGKLSVELHLEREDLKVEVCCHSVQVTSPL